MKAVSLFQYFNVILVLYMLGVYVLNSSVDTTCGGETAVILSKMINLGESTHSFINQ